MTVSGTMTHAEAALAIARALGPVLPLCYARDGGCVCSGEWDQELGKLVPHQGHDIAKAPISKLVRNGVDDATRNSATIDRHWRQEPDAGVGLDLKAAGIVFVDPDSPAAYAEAIAQGVEGGVLRSSRNDGFLFKRPADCPIINISKSADGTDLEIRTLGYVVGWNTHQDGSEVRIDLSAPLREAPAWVIERLKRKAAEKAEQDAVRAARRAERAANGTGSEPPVRLHQRGMCRWNGELVQRKESGDVDHSDSLYFIGLDLAECNASEATIRLAVEERDAALGWHKYTNRTDADERYQEIAEKVVAYVVNREKQPELQIAPKAPTDGSLDEVIAFAEATAAENLRLRRVIQDQGDRLEILEPIVTQIDEIIARPEFEYDDEGNLTGYGPTSDDKLVDITIARWMPHWRTRKEANGERPTVSLGYLSKVMGMPKRRISKSLERQSGRAEDGAPFEKIVSRRPMVDNQGQPIRNDDGSQRWESSLEIRPWGDSPAATLRAAATYALPERPKHGGSKQAADIRWGRCDKHQNREVRVKGYCPDCGKVVGERVMRLAEFDALNAQVEHSEGDLSPVSSSNSIEVQVEHSEVPNHGPERLNVQVVDSGPPLNLLDYAASRDAEPPTRCPAPGCRAMEFRPHPGGWRCLRSGHDPQVYEPVAVSGGSE